MVRLSVNVNKIATLRNSRTPPTVQAEYPGVPSMTRAVHACLRAGARGLTVHPREDQRHVTLDDVRAAAALIEPRRHEIELNVEGDPRPDLVALVHEVLPHQLTLVPVRPGEVTSQAGWPPYTPRDTLGRVIDEAKAAGIRVSLFIDPTPEAVDWAARMGADRVELYTEPYARAHRLGTHTAEANLNTYREAAELAHERGLGVNAGHDLDLENLVLFKTLPHLEEVSIGHALVAEAVFEGLEAVVKRYLELLAAD